MLLILNDTHLGRRAGAHTTVDSSKRLDLAIFNTAKKVVIEKPDNCETIHGGDLFDRFSNKEDVILQGMEIAKHCDLISAANHDLSNRDNAQSSIEVVGKVFDNVLMAKVNEVVCEDFETDDGIQFYMIPHHSSQDLFDQAVEKCCATGETDKCDIVFIHANYNNPFAQNDASLNLSIEAAEKLLEKFKYIVLAHEHSYREELGGRLIVTGNTHPTSFGDISDKFFWGYTVSEGFTKTLCWSKDTGYVRIKVGDLVSGGFNFPTTPNFIEIVGEDTDPALAPEIASAMQDIWDVCDDNLYMVRNNVKFKQLVATTVDTGVQLEDVTKAITKDLEKSDLQPLWLKHLGAASNA